MNPIELKILVHNDETVTAETLEQDIHPTDFDAQPMLFLTIDNIQGINIKETELTIVSSGGEDFTCTTPYEKLKAKLLANNIK